AIGARSDAACQNVGLGGNVSFIAPGIKWKKLTRSKLPVLGEYRNKLRDNRANNLKVGVLVNLIACKIRGEAFSNIHSPGKSNIAINDKNFSMAAQIGIRHAHPPGVCHKQGIWDAFTSEAPNNRRS